MNADAPASAKVPRVPSVSHAMAILRRLGRATEPLGVTAIARDVGLSPSSCFNIVRTLVDEDLVEFNPVTKGYRIGLGLTEFARSASRRNDAVRAALPLLDSLAERHDAQCGLWRLTRGRRLVLVAASESHAATRIHMVVGQRQPVYAGAAGRAVAAALGATAEELHEALATIRWQRPIEASRYLDEVREAAERGWAVDEGFYFRGVTTIAAAVRDGTGEVGFCVTASTFSARLSDAGSRSIGEDVQRTADRLAGRT